MGTSTSHIMMNRALTLFALVGLCTAFSPQDAPTPCDDTSLGRVLGAMDPANYAEWGYPFTNVTEMEMFLDPLSCMYESAAGLGQPGFVETTPTALTQNECRCYMLLSRESLANENCCIDCIAPTTMAEDDWDQCSDHIAEGYWDDCGHKDGDNKEHCTSN